MIRLLVFLFVVVPVKLFVVLPARVLGGLAGLFGRALGGAVQLLVLPVRLLGAVIWGLTLPLRLVAASLRVVLR